MPNQSLNKAKDPAQLRLREHKRKWNASYKDLTGKLKAFKNGLNGKGDTKHSLPPSDIKNPVPNEVGSYLNQLAAQFQSLVTDANAIIKEQNTYSSTRKKKQPKQAPSGNLSKNDKVVEDLSRIASFSFEKDASNKLTRFWQYFKSIFSREELTKFRVSMLRMSSDLHYSLLDFQNEVLTLELGSVPRSITKYQMARYNFEALKRSVDNLKEFIERAKERDKENEISDEEEASSTPAPVVSDEQPVQNIEQPAQNIEEPKAVEPVAIQPSDDILKIKRDIHSLFNDPIPEKIKQYLVQLNTLIDECNQEEDQHLKSVMKDRIIGGYNDAIKAINIHKKKASNSSEIIKEAHNAITRFLKKQVVKAIPFNKTAAHRIEISDLIDSCDDIVEKLMNHLEDDIDFASVNILIAEINKQITAMSRPLSVLVIFYKEEFYKTKKHDKSKNIHMNEDPMLDFVMTRKVRRDLSRDID